MERRSTFLEGVCASVTFDSRGRIETVCVGVEGPKLLLLDPRRSKTLAAMPLPPRQPGGGNLFTDFAGGGYFYLDNRDRAVIPTTLRHVYVVRQTGAASRSSATTTSRPSCCRATRSSRRCRTGAGGCGSRRRTGWSGPSTRRPARSASRPLGEKIANSFAVEDTGAVYIVSDAALYRLTAGAGGMPATVWRKPYAELGVQKPGQSSAGSGTTPTLMGAGLVAITDNADPMNVLVYRRGSGALICRQPVFAKGASATDQSLIGTGRSLVVENNYGYSGPPATQGGKTTSPGLERVDLDAGGGCHTAWRSAERAPSVVPKLSARNGLVYTYTKDPQPSNADAWYLTALDFASGRTVYKRLGGEGLGFNNNYAPVTLGPDGTAYVGTLGGLVGAARQDAAARGRARLGREAGEAAADPAARAAAGAQARAGVADGRRHATGAARGLHARQEAAGARPPAAVRAQRPRGAEAGAAEGADRVAGRAEGGAGQACAAGSSNCALRGRRGGVGALSTGITSVTQPVGDRPRELCRLERHIPSSRPRRRTAGEMPPDLI